MLLAILIIGGTLYYREYRKKNYWTCRNGQWVKIGNPLISIFQKNCQTTKNEIAPNFIKSGNLVDGPDWNLLYEEPGKPALKARLIFNEKSVCNIGSQASPCRPEGFTQGERVEIKGRKSGSDIIVQNLFKLE